MDEPIAILVIEDSRDDFLMLERHLKQQGLAVRCSRVDSLKGLQEAIDGESWGVVLADYNIPGLSFLDGLNLIRAKCPDLPVILVSGAMGEEKAVELLKSGVQDFVLKDNLTRLVPVVQRALKDKQALLEHRHTEGKLAAERTMLRTLIDTIPDLVWLKDPAGVYLACNPEFERFFGASETDIYGKTDYDFVDRELADFFREHDRMAMAADAPSSNEEWITYASDGHRAQLETIKTPMFDSNRQLIGVLGIGRNITALKEAQQALQQSEVLYRSLFENMMNGLAYCRMIYDGETPLDFIFLSVNEAFEKQSGLKNVIGRRVSEIIPGIRETDPGMFEVYGRVALTGNPEQLEIYVKALEQWFWISVYSPAKEHFVAVFDVITERKQAETELNKKNAEIEQFIYSVSHDLRSPLVTVKTFLGYLEKDMAEDNQLQLGEDLQFIHSAADKMTMLLDELLELSRVGRIETPAVSVQLAELLAEAQATLAGIINERRVEIQLPDRDLTLVGDRPRLCQIWQNLIENAIKYNHADSIPRIELGLRQEGEETLFFVRDNGLGIDPRYHRKIFGIFEKLDPTSPGAGMGLSLVQRIVERNGGRIWVESEGIDSGSCFFFTLPQALLQS